MSAQVDTARLNIRVQIHNSMAAEEEGKMEVDIEPEEGEEGEITEEGDEDMLLQDLQETTKEPLVKEIKEVRGVFTTGINLFDKEEQKKLQERARRFALKPEEVKNFTDKDLQELHKSLGITPENESEIKFNVLHLHGIDGINAEDILKAFENYAPDGIEYIENNTCNVVWLDNISAARALHYTSKPVNGMPARDAADLFPKEFLDEVTEVPEEEGTGQSILLKNQDREVELREDDVVIMPQKKVYIKGAVDISEIKTTIPPGYWRLSSCPMFERVLIRFGLLSDKISYRSEPFSKYYKKTSLGTNKHIISEKKKKEIKTLFERNKELIHDKNNPWGPIAKDWDNDSKYRERSPIMYDDAGLEDHPPIEIKNSKMLARLGKRKVDDGNIEEEIEFVEKIIEEKKSKMPRMKMYADEEEERIKRKKLIQKIKAQTQKIEDANKKVDLRNMLGRTGNVRESEKIVESAPEIDLGSRLKNRSQKMVFAIERNDIEVLAEDTPRSPNEVLQDVRSLLLDRRNNRERRIKIEKRVTPPKRRSTERSHRSKRRDDNRKDHKDRTHPSERLYSDRLDTERDRRTKVSRHYRSSSYEKHAQKPRSRVVVKPPASSTPQKPTVASTVWSRVKKSSDSSEESSSDTDSDDSDDSESESSSSSSESESESESDNDSDSSSSSSSGSNKPSKTQEKTVKSNNSSSKKITRPGFEKPSSIKDRLSDKKVDGRSPLKITTTNNRYKSKR